MTANKHIIMMDISYFLVYLPKYYNVGTVEYNDELLFSNLLE